MMEELIDGGIYQPSGPTLGVRFQMMALDGKSDCYLWLLEAHRGQFGQINLEGICPFLNALGLLTLLLTGLIL